MQPHQIRLKIHEPASYRICVQGRLDEDWADLFGGLTITHSPNADANYMTVLTGQVMDQAMLLGVLNGLYGLGLCLLCVECLTGNGTPQKTLTTSHNPAQQP